MSETIGLVVVTPAHAPVLAALHRVCFADQPWHRPWRDSEMAEVLALPGLRGWLATVETPGPDTDPAGMLLVQIGGDSADILTIATRPGPLRRRGIGRALLARAEADLSGGGVARMILEVAEENSAAIAFYSAHGYTVAGRRPGYYAATGGPSRDALVMARPLLPSAGDSPPE
ncbi:GNAT family N-acetyltransferase [Rhodospira trueperi]|uniref:Ribosomal-protein-alanine N-acetyltransferase n=1 Tax=Rhodospira trueperi TaxID=69960 RepID=A0A1G7EC12_9PROT|nr:N-acetyltransferase [Rhodospira trueperi]SDE61202.1 ribosomal-protein-alanine N-acetyltransferase [Rhodospira trueperi]